MLLSFDIIRNFNKLIFIIIMLTPSPVGFRVVDIYRVMKLDAIVCVLE